MSKTIDMFLRGCYFISSFPFWDFLIAALEGAQTLIYDKIYITQKYFRIFFSEKHL